MSRVTSWYLISGKILGVLPLTTTKKCYILTNRIYSFIWMLFFITSFSQVILESFSPLFFAFSCIFTQRKKFIELVNRLKVIEKACGSRIPWELLSLLIFIFIYFIPVLIYSNFNDYCSFYCTVILSRFAFYNVTLFTGHVALMYKKQFKGLKTYYRKKSRCLFNEREYLSLIISVRKKYMQCLEDVQAYNAVFGLGFMSGVFGQVFLVASVVHIYNESKENTYFMLRQTIPTLGVCAAIFFSILCCDAALEEADNLKKICFDVLDGPLLNHQTEEPYQRTLELIQFLNQYPPTFTADGYYTINRMTILKILSIIMTYLIVTLTW